MVGSKAFFVRLKYLCYIALVLQFLCITLTFCEIVCMEGMRQWRGIVRESFEQKNKFYLKGGASTQSVYEYVKKPPC